MQLALICENPERQNELDELAQRWGLSHDENSIFALVLTDTQLELRKLDEAKLGAVFVDLVSGAAAHRRKFGGGRGQAIAKAVGLKKGVMPRVLDGTAGLGRDAFVLASLGCTVQMVERHPVVYQMLKQALSGLDQNLANRLCFLHLDSAQNHFERQLKGTFESTMSFDLVYLDPMFQGSTQKRAKSRKPMQIMQQLVSAPTMDNERCLFENAMNIATKRVVVKRALNAAYIDDRVPQGSIKSKLLRFDLYKP